ncbi:MAG TPA: histidinol dehydrogenase, partial [Arenibacter sp.]|nr:histidinol dehydrogenase [Arenibacter sp.]
MNKIYNPERAQWKTVLKRPTQSVSDIEDIVNSVFREIKAGGDTVVSSYTKKFDGVVLKDALVPSVEIEESNKLISSDLKAAIQQAKNNIEKFH